MRERLRHHIKRTQPNQIDAHDELQSNYQKLESSNLAERQAMIDDDYNTPLEETRAILADEAHQRYFHVPSLNQFMMSKIYRQVALEATKHFGRNITHRNVKDCVSSWLAFEHSLEEISE